MVKETDVKWTGVEAECEQRTCNFKSDSSQRGFARLKRRSACAFETAAVISKSVSGDHGLGRESRVAAPPVGMQTGSCL